VAIVDIEAPKCGSKEIEAVIRFLTSIAPAVRKKQRNLIVATIDEI